jgi:hypothetical protein
MAKIAANGAYEIAAINTISPAGTKYRWAMNSRGTVLRRWRGELETGYTVFVKMDRKAATKNTLLALINLEGHVLDE